MTRTLTGTARHTRRQPGTFPATISLQTTQSNWPTLTLSVPMNFTISVDTSRGIVRITHKDEMSLEDMLEGRRQVGLKMQETGYSKMLVDVLDVASAPGTMDTFEISSSHHRDLPDDFRLAILAPAHMIKDAKFGETVGVNRGFIIKAFQDEEEAIAWLTSP